MSSGNILVNDKVEGLFVVEATAPYDPPSAPTLSAQRVRSSEVTLTWNDVPNARGYSVERSVDGITYNTIADHLLSTSYTDSVSVGVTASYKVVAINGEGTSSSTVESILPGICSNDETNDCASTGDCACGATESAIFGRLRARKLADPCNGNKKRNCSGSCIWSGGNCITNGPLPSQSPTKTVSLLFIYIWSLPMKRIS